MALFGSTLPNELGLKLLLCPLGSNVVVRTACCSIGIVFPVYSTFKAIESKNQNEQERWLLYWAVYGSFSIGEAFADKFLYRFPLYYHLKFAFLVWLQLPSTDGSRQLYMNHLRPFLLRHQARFDEVLGLFYGEMAKFVSAHQTEIQFARSLIAKIVVAASQLAKEVFGQNVASEGSRARIASESNATVSPGDRLVDGAIESPIEELTSGSDIDE